MSKPFVNSVFLLPILLVLFISCQEEETINPARRAQIVFSEDTVSFDTLLTSRTSITKRLRIYNKEDDPVRLSEIRIAGGESSPYKLVLNSFKGNSFSDLIIAGGDSVLALIEVTVDPQNENTPFLVKDSLIASWNGNQVNIKLRAWGQEARYIRNQIICDETWYNALPYVITRDLLVDSLCQLTIEAGTQIYFDNGIRFLVQGQLLVKGDTGRQVVFRNSRFDEAYVEAPGQWDGIFFLEGSSDNLIEYAVIENSINGIRLGSPDPDTIPDVVIRNSVFRHFTQNAIRSFTSDLYAENCLFFNSGSQLLFNVAGGNYTYKHCTFSNDPSFFINEDPVILGSDNLTLSDNSSIIEPFSFEITNSIIDSNQEENLFFSITETVPYTLRITNNAIRSEEELAGNIVYQNSSDIGFVDRRNFDFQLDSASLAIDKGDNPAVEIDLTGMKRDRRPDIGAFEYIKN